MYLQSVQHFTKETFKLTAFDDSAVNDDSLESVRGLVFNPSGSETDLSASFRDYLSLVNNTGQSARLKKKVEVLRFEPTNTFTSDTLRKSVIRTTLYPFYRPYYPSLNWAYTQLSLFEFFYFLASYHWILLNISWNNSWKCRHQSILSI